MIRKGQRLHSEIETEMEGNVSDLNNLVWKMERKMLEEDKRPLWRM